QEAQADLVGYAAHLVQVAFHFAAGLVDGLQLRAGQFQLPGRFQCHRSAVLEQRDGARRFAVDAFLHRLPAEAGQSGEQGLDAAFAVERRRTQVVEAESELLVLGADAPVGARARTAGQVLDQLAPVGDRGFGDAAGARHERMIRGSGAYRSSQPFTTARASSTPCFDSPENTCTLT